ncbi:MAG: heparinase II/III family protein [Salaquimonas sp.]
MALGENLKILLLAAREKARRMAIRMRRNSPSVILSSSYSADHLILAPQDLHTPDSAAAMEIYSGRFFLGGKMIDCYGTDPFLRTDTPQIWQTELHSFGWLRHLEAEGSALTKSNAQILINDWMTNHSKPKNSIAWRGDIPAKRLISWICHSVPVVQAATPRFYQQWLKSIVTHINFLKYRANELGDGTPLLFVRIALAYAAICVSDQQKTLRHAQRLLDQELQLQITQDGTHISRNPAVTADILALLLPLRQSYARLGIAPSQTLVSSIDRLMAALKFYQLGDGNLARFNGVSLPRPDLVSTILFYDDSMGIASENAPYSGYQRMAMGDTVLLADTGKPPQGGNSRMAHAGTLSFELSSGVNLLMVNCGRPSDPNSNLATIARSTAAHNTATLNDTSSSRFYLGQKFINLLKNRIIAAPKQVDCKRQDGEGFKQFTASHNGYRKTFGAIHQRTLKMTDNGMRVEGQDSFTGIGGTQIRSKREVEFAIRFHLHPSVSAGKTDDGRSILMMCGNGLIWKLTCIDCPPEIEESIFLSSTSGPKRTKQIVLTGNAKELSEIRWLLTKEKNVR